VVQLSEYLGRLARDGGRVHPAVPAPPEDLVADARTEAQRRLDEVTAGRPDGAPSVSVDVEAVAGHPVGFQNLAMGAELRFYATPSYSLMSHPRTSRRLIRGRSRSRAG
jgi:hypothetical protein